MARLVGFTDANVPDQSGKIFLVTGIDAGLCRQVKAKLLRAQQS